jgi:transposase
LFLKNLNPVRRIRELAEELSRTRRQGEQARKENEQLQEENQRLEKQNQQLEKEIQRLQKESERLREERQRLRQDNERLRKDLEAAQRAAKRQAAPFSRGKPKANPRTPGRKSGAAHGPHSHRPIPDHVDEEIQVAAPEKCPDCGGPLTVERVETQYQEEIVRRTYVRRFHIPICRCAQCAKRVQGRHPLQTSDALGAAAVQVGPETVALGVLMNKSMGLPHADAAAILKHGFGLSMTPGGICRAIQRVARKAEATWQALRKAARRSLVAHMDETSWKVDAQLRWLWAVVTEQVTFCEILPGRGFAQAKKILGAGYAGWLVHDGLRLYYKFLQAAHQSCLFHLIHRCQQMAEASPKTSPFPLAVKQLLEQALALRDRYRQKQISLHGMWTATGRLETKLDRLLAGSQRERANQRLARHLRHERPYLFTFLYCPGLEATNNVAERVMRILVMIRKNWGGNRTQKGARTQAVLTSILCTAKQQDKDLFALIVDLLRSAEPKLLDLIPELAAETALGAAGEKPAVQTPPTQRESVAKRREVDLTPPPGLLQGLAAGEKAALFSSA